ncbi:ABC transporter ATP-binding protein [Atopobacter sp. AH10]|uniref:ABC transporter ATP-binding protein n=1 Tax=Atopobacter sp. AH10 TaxID=2315861 RepID=UPI000EF19DB4|nr:ABC transporter ATP-binding protein [Atopobacter sp. AH10]RLK63472.1 ABC transporter ATP-binding protein [Atopobacter sp. AH10]
MTGGKKQEKVDTFENEANQGAGLKKVREDVSGRADQAVNASAQEDILLEVKDLEIHFHSQDGEVEAVRSISFHLRQGETLAIVGESGSGKTVSSRSLMGLLGKNAEIVAGSIQYLGRELTTLDDKGFQKIRGSEIAMVFQDPMTALNPTLTIGRQIEEVLLYKRGFSKKEARKEAIHLLEKCGLTQAEERLFQYPHQLSGGQRQRIVIAIALAGKPKLLIADEATTALDVTIQAQIIELLKKLQEEAGMAMIFISHDLGVVARIADRVAVMYAGKIVETGRVDQIFYHPQHPYTWGLLASLPTLETKGRLHTIPGTPPVLIHPPKGDAFAARNAYALAIDWEMEPPLFQVEEDHYAATWLLHPLAPRLVLPEHIQKRFAYYQARKEEKIDDQNRLEQISDRRA